MKSAPRISVIILAQIGSTLRVSQRRVRGGEAETLASVARATAFNSPCLFAGC